MMAWEDVIVVRALILLLRLGRFLEPDGLFRFAPSFVVFGLCVDVRHPVQIWVVETLQVERNWVN